MKLITNLIGMAAAGTIGYMTEPKLRFDLTGISPSKTEIAANGRVVINMPGDEPEIDISNLTRAQLPSKVLIKSDVKVSDALNDLNITIPAGSHVNLIRIEGGNAVVSPAGTQAVGMIPIVETDLVKQISEGIPPQALPAPAVSETPILTQGDSQEPAAVPPAPPMQEPAPVPPVALPDPAPAPEPPPTVEPAVQPETAAVATPPPGAPADIVQVMQESIRSAQIKEFSFAQVLDWKAEADETVDGESYQTGLASYKAETIFGVKTIQAKALIKDGKVKRWIWPKSGMDIK